MTDWLSPDAVPEQSELDKRDPRNTDDLDKNEEKKYKTKIHRDVVEVGRSGGNPEVSSHIHRQVLGPKAWLETCCFFED